MPVSQAESLLGETLRTGRIRYVFQPVWDLRSGSLVGFDALPRFRGGTSPGAVWGAAHASDVRSPLERIAARQAVVHAHRLPGLLFIGLSRCCAELPGALHAALAATSGTGHARPERLVFDLAAQDIDDPEEAGRSLARLRRAGAGLSLNAGAGLCPPDRFGPLAPMLGFLRLEAPPPGAPPDGSDAFERWSAWGRAYGLTVVATEVDERSAAAALLAAGIGAAQGRAFGEPAPASRWTPQRLGEAAPPAAVRPPRTPEDGRPEAEATAARPSESTRAARRLPTPAEIATRWRPLYRNDTWMAAVHNLQRYLERQTWADRFVLWACLPPHGYWQRIAWGRPLHAAICLPPDTEPLASVRAGLKTRVHPPAPASPAYRRILDEEHVRYARLTPLTVPAPAGGRSHFVGILALGWCQAPPPATTAATTEEGGLVSVIAYLLGQRIQSGFIESALDWVASQPAPASAGDWVPMLDALAEWFGGDHWVLSAVDTPPGKPATWHAVAESGCAPGTGAEWADYVALCGGALAAAPGLRTAAQGRIDFVADLERPAAASPELHQWQRRLSERGLRSLLTLPLGPGADGRTGVLVVHWRHPRGWQQIDASVRPWEALRRLLAGWWREMTSTRDMLHDSLTGVLSRRGVARLWRPGATWAGTLGILDCDGFHQVNNLWGHLVGDDVLRNLGGALDAEAGRRGGWCGRWGGDEFVVYLPEGSVWSDFGRHVLRRLTELEHERGWPQRVTISGGAVRFRAPGPVLETALGLADRALFRAKTAGGARFYSHSRIMG